MTAVNALGDFQLSSHRLAFIDGDGMKLFVTYRPTLLTSIWQRIPGVKQLPTAGMRLSAKTRLGDRSSGLKLEFITMTRVA